MATTTASGLYRSRLLRDIAELCTPPAYPNIKLHPPADGPDGLRGTACLLLTTEAYGPSPLHLSVCFPDNYPVAPPRVTMDTPDVSHPNVFGTYICASILNTVEGYTSAYTLKSVAIQLLSFFSSDSVEQVSGGTVELAAYWEKRSRGRDHCQPLHRTEHWTCTRCGYDTADEAAMRRAAATEENAAGDAHGTDGATADAVVASLPLLPPPPPPPPLPSMDRLPDDVLMLIVQDLDATTLGAFASASDRVRRLLQLHDVRRQQELQCFCLKTSYLRSDLGVGVSTPAPSGAARRRGVESEFDLLSREAFSLLRVRRSVQGIAFRHWLPLPLSRRHWLRVRSDAVRCLDALADDVLPPSRRPRGGARRGSARPRRGSSQGRLRALRQATTPAAPSDLSRATEVLLLFMTQVVVRLNEDVGKMRGGDTWEDNVWVAGPAPSTSTLRHASEKAIESFFHLFHLLVCLAAEHPELAADANRRIRSFYIDGRRSKEDCPNLGMLLVALLIADDRAIGLAEGAAGTRQGLLKAIVSEAITRNVVWLLDRRGAGRAELAHLEPDGTVSAYRLHHTFVGSRTSYRLLMFMELFRRTARPPQPGGGGGAAESLEAVRDGLYRRHGAPPAGAAAHLAAEVRRLQAIQTWPDFLAAMGLAAPTEAAFCNVLRRAVRDSMAWGYSQWGLMADEAKALRDYHEDLFRRGVTAVPILRRAERAAGDQPRQGTVDEALSVLADETYGQLQQLRWNEPDGPWRTTASMQETVSAAYAQWRLQSGEVTFFPTRRPRT